MKLNKEVNEFVKEVGRELENYAKVITAIEREKRKEIEEIKEMEDMDLDEMEEVIACVEDEYEDKKNDEEINLVEKIEDLARKHGLQLMGNIFICEDENTYASGMGFKHTSVCYLVCSIKLSESRMLRIYADFTESDVYGKYDFVFNNLSFKEVPIINPKKTPFSQELLITIPWNRIRGTWGHNIERILKKITEAEWKGKEELKRAVEEVEEELKTSSWIYDYQHVLTALREVREKFNI